MTATLRIAEPKSVAQVVELLQTDPGARCLAGGATLVAMMNAGLADDVSLLVSLQSVDELRGIERRADGSVRIGAMTRHVETAGSMLLIEGQQVVCEAAKVVANHVVRNMGTIGGSVAFADPAADYLPALLVADAVIDVAGPAGRRRVPIGEYGLDWYTTALMPGEIVVSIELPPAPANSIGLYKKFGRTYGDFAIASIAVILCAAQGRAATIRCAVGACGPAPVRLPQAEELLQGTALESAVVAKAGRLLADACDPLDDVRASSAFRRTLVPRLLGSALGEAWQRLEHGR